MPDPERASPLVPPPGACAAPSRTPEQRRIQQERDSARVREHASTMRVLRRASTHRERVRARVRNRAAAGRAIPRTREHRFTRETRAGPDDDPHEQPAPRCRPPLGGPTRRDGSPPVSGSPSEQRGWQ